MSISFPFFILFLNRGYKEKGLKIPLNIISRFLSQIFRILRPPSTTFSPAATFHYLFPSWAAITRNKGRGTSCSLNISIVRAQSTMSVVYLVFRYFVAEQRPPYLYLHKIAKSRTVSPMNPRIFRGGIRIRALEGKYASNFQLVSFPRHHAFHDSLAGVAAATSSSQPIFLSFVHRYRIVIIFGGRK